MIKLNLDAAASASWSDVVTDILNRSGRDADTKRSTEAEKTKAISGSKAGSENGWIETTFGIEVMKIYCRKERNRAERAKATTGSKAGSEKQSRQQEAKQTGVVDVET